MKVQFQPVRVAAGEDGDGLLVLVEGWLIAVLVRLSDQHGALSGHWFLESGYGRFAGPEQPTFSDLSTAEAWFGSHLADFSRVNPDPWQGRQVGVKR